MMNKEKIKNFWEEHKTKIILTSGLTMLTGVGLILWGSIENSTIRKNLSDIPDNMRRFNLEKEKQRIETFGCAVGKVTDMWDEAGYLHMIIDDIPIGDLGKLGKEFSRLEEVTKDSTVSVVAAIG